MQRERGTKEEVGREESTNTCYVQRRQQSSKQATNKHTQHTQYTDKRTTIQPLECAAQSKEKGHGEALMPMCLLKSLCATGWGANPVARGPWGIDTVAPGICFLVKPLQLLLLCNNVVNLQACTCIEVCVCVCVCVCV